MAAHSMTFLVVLLMRGALGGVSSASGSTSVTSENATGVTGEHSGGRIGRNVLGAQGRRTIDTRAIHGRRAQPQQQPFQPRPLAHPQLDEQAAAAQLLDFL